LAPTSTLFPYTTLFRSGSISRRLHGHHLFSLRIGKGHPRRCLRRLHPVRHQPRLQLIYPRGRGFHPPASSTSSTSLSSSIQIRRSEEHTSELQSRENLV